MLVISAGMQKSGSAYLYNVINDLLVRSGHPDAKVIKETYNLQRVMRWKNNNVGHLDNKKLLKLFWLSLRAGSFVVKTHWEPPSIHPYLLKAGLLKTVYIYRDPRDSFLSAKDHGRRIVEEGEHYGFANLLDLDIEQAVLEVKKWTDVYQVYKHARGVLSIKYEDLISRPEEKVAEVCTYLGLKPSQDTIDEVLQKYKKKSVRADTKALHYNKGVARRYEEEMSEKEKAVFEKALGPVIAAMGYPLQSSSASQRERAG